MTCLFNRSATQGKCHEIGNTGFSKKARRLLKLEKDINLADTYLVDQEYTGDINIFPGFRFFGPKKIISAVSPEEIQFLIDDGERATWSKIESIRNNTLIGRTLDEILVEFEKNELHWLRTGPKVFTHDNTDEPEHLASVAPLLP